MTAGQLTDTVTQLLYVTQEVRENVNMIIQPDSTIDVNRHR